jgi:hypothetical protein
MKALLIVNCKDSMLWYADRIGDVVLLLREFNDCYMSREPTGYSNIVHKADTVEVNVPDGSDLATILLGELRVKP